MPDTLKNFAHVALVAATLSIYGCATQTKIADSEIRQEYERIAAQMSSEYRVRHILVETREQAQEALNRLKAGESFAVVARLISRDAGSRNAGGELGWNVPIYFIEEFSNAMIGLAPHGLTATPIQTKFGWHVIEVLGVRKATIRPFDEVRDRIAVKLQERASNADAIATTAEPLPDSPISAVYPRSSILANHEGTAVVIVRVLHDGSVGSVDIGHSSGFRQLDDAAVAAAKNIHWSPAKTKSGRAVDSELRFPFHFKLDN